MGIILTEEQNNLVNDYIYFDDSPKHERVGESIVNKYGTEMKIIDYNNIRDITLFQKSRMIDGTYKVYVRDKVRYHDFIRGGVSSPYDLTACGMGYRGTISYTSNDLEKLFLNRWHKMLRRCSGEYLLERPSYENVYVDDYFLNFSNFCNWCYDNYYTVSTGEKMQLDKDILFKGNRCYGPNTCVFVPQTINTLFINSKATRGSLPLGVERERNKYHVKLSINNITKHFGYYNTVEEAFSVYKKVKEQHIRNMADLYRDEIPEKLYTAMYNYEIEITD